jgi:hypothetical protein
MARWRCWISATSARTLAAPSLVKSPVKCPAMSFDRSPPLWYRASSRSRCWSVLSVSDISMARVPRRCTICGLAMSLSATVAMSCVAKSTASRAACPWFEPQNWSNRARYAACRPFTIIRFCISLSVVGSSPVNWLASRNRAISSADGSRYPWVFLRSAMSASDTSNILSASAPNMPLIAAVSSAADPYLGWTPIPRRAARSRLVAISDASASVRPGYSFFISSIWALSGRYGTMRRRVRIMARASSSLSTLGSTGLPS